jgi:hypothetical protein
MCELDDKQSRGCIHGHRLRRRMSANEKSTAGVPLSPQEPMCQVESERAVSAEKVVVGADKVDVQVSSVVSILPIVR